jgi:hypothetical protein
MAAKQTEHAVPHRTPWGRGAKSDTLRAFATACPSSMEIAFNERGVSVARNGLSAAGQLFALRDIRGLRVVTERKNKVVPLLVSLAGLAGAVAGGVFGSGAGLALGTMLIVVGYLSWLTQDVTHRLIVAMPDGEREALMSTDLDFVERVEQAVRDALERVAAQPSKATRPASR